MKERSDEMRDARTARERSVGELLREIHVEFDDDMRPFVAMAAAQRAAAQLPALARVLDAADAMREGFGGAGGPYSECIASDDALCAAYDAALRELRKALEG